MREGEELQGDVECFRLPHARFVGALRIASSAAVRMMRAERVHEGPVPVVPCPGSSAVTARPARRATLSAAAIVVKAV